MGGPSPSAAGTVTAAASAAGLGSTARSTAGLGSAPWASPSGLGSAGGVASLTAASAAGRAGAGGAAASAAGLAGAGGAALLVVTAIGAIDAIDELRAGGEATPAQVLQPDACLQRTQQHWAEEPLHKKQASGTHLSIPEQQPHH